MGDARGGQEFVVLPLHHVTFEHTAPDGTLRVWDVTEGNRIAAKGHALLDFPLGYHGMTEDKVRELYRGIDEEYAMATDLSKPLLLIPLGEECLIIDGWHRLFHAARLGLSGLPAYFLEPEEADAILLLEQPPGQPPRRLVVIAVTGGKNV